MSTIDDDVPNDEYQGLGDNAFNDAAKQFEECTKAFCKSEVESVELKEKNTNQFIAGVLLFYLQCADETDRLSEYLESQGIDPHSKKSNIFTKIVKAANHIVGGKFSTPSITTYSQALRGLVSANKQTEFNGKEGVIEWLEKREEVGGKSHTGIVKARGVFWETPEGQDRKRINEEKKELRRAKAEERRMDDARVAAARPEREAKAKEWLDSAPGETKPIEEIVSWSRGIVEAGRKQYVILTANENGEILFWADNRPSDP